MTASLPATPSSCPRPERRLVKFQRVNCLTLFIESNQGDADTTIVQKIALLGSAGDSFNVAAIKNVSKEYD